MQPVVLIGMAPLEEESRTAGKKSESRWNEKQNPPDPRRLKHNSSSKPCDWQRGGVRSEWYNARYVSRENEGEVGHCSKQFTHVLEIPSEWIAERQGCGVVCLGPNNL
jgi:hypothetical protein